MKNKLNKHKPFTFTSLNNYLSKRNVAFPYTKN